MSSGCRTELRCPRGTILALVPAVCACLVLASCDKDSLVTPPGTVPGEFPDSAEQMMVNMRSAYGEMDSVGYAAVIHPDFRFYFADEDVQSLLLPSDYLLAGEELKSAYNMFSGELIDHDDGSLEAAISFISFDILEPVDAEWTEADGSTPFPGTQRRAYDVLLNIERPGNTTMQITSRQEFFVTSHDSLLGDGTIASFFQLAGQQESIPSAKPTQEFSWGRIKLAYLTNEAPTPYLEYEEVAGTNDPTFAFDATGSHDEDSGLHAEPYRWRPESRQEYTEWSSNPLFSVSFQDFPGIKAVTLEVRDRWGRTDTTSAIFPVDAVFPGTPDKLMANFKKAYDEMDIEGYREILEAAYKFFFQQADIDNLGLTFDYWERDDELQSAANIFSGDPSPSSGEAGVSDIDFNFLEAATVWEDSVNPDFPGARRALYQVILFFERPGTTTIEVQGRQEFYVTSHDSVQEDDFIKDYYQVVGQVDLSDISYGKSEGSSWGNVKSLYK